MLCPLNFIYIITDDIDCNNKLIFIITELI